jgi:iron complex transport system substrate-binding protein
MELAKLLTVATVLGAHAVTLPAQPITVRDGAGNVITLRAPARRVASLVSSSIDMIVALGAANRIAARTRYDTASVVAKAVSVGGGLDPSVETLVAARPDLFFAWIGQASTPVVQRMRALGVPVYLVETKDTTALFANARNIGVMLGLAPRADSAANALREQFRRAQVVARGHTRLRTVYVISMSPVIIAAAKSYMAELIGVAGGDNPFSDVRGEFPTISLESFIARDPDVIVMGHRERGGKQLDVLRATPGWRDLRAVKRGAVIEVNGEHWSRPTLSIGLLVQSLAADIRALPANVPR